jgi:hypothetical protein
MRKVATGTIFEFANHLALFACSISYVKWVQREMCWLKTHLLIGEFITAHDSVGGGMEIPPCLQPQCVLDCCLGTYLLLVGGTKTKHITIQGLS